MSVKLVIFIAECGNIKGATKKKIATFIEQLKNSGLTTSHGKSSKHVKAKMEPVSWKSITLKNLTPIEMAII